ncbi:PfkB family carbohydrate kinase [Poriferisphaera sp. WC338]|uniref:PfkB family carbohydrate kinase n=1 Tax=Poriferisphaera sp. WC338 TaxID=3425129 RepID=UPI003D815018
MNNKPIFVGIGESLFDCFPDGMLLGGAPLNVAYHAHQLAQVSGGCGVVLSRIGQDDLGKRLIKELAEKGICTDFVQVDEMHETGRVDVSFSQDGEPEYQIAKDVAWDYLEYTEEMALLSQRIAGVAFGTLALRSRTSCESILRFIESTKQAIRLYDVNLRPEIDFSIVEKAIIVSNVLKMNEYELPELARMFSLKASPEAFVKKFSLKAVVLTRGKRGTVITTDQEKVEGEAAIFSADHDADSVGAGDACAAGVMYGLASGWSLQKTVDLANKCGAYVAGKFGATPTLPVAEMV